VQLGDSLEEYLIEATSDANLRQLMMSMSEAIRTIAFKARSRLGPHRCQPAQPACMLPLAAPATERSTCCLA
jgi:hypothetical protein